MYLKRKPLPLHSKGFYLITKKASHPLRYEAYVPHRKLYGLREKGLEPSRLVATRSLV